MLSDFISEDRWVFPRSDHASLMEMRSIISQNVTISSGRSDSISWHGFQAVSLSTIWSSLNPCNSQIVEWHSILWNKLHVPRFSFMVRVAIPMRLFTADRLRRFGINIEPQCVLCNSQDESHDYLFFSCNHSTKLLSGTPGSDWNGLIRNLANATHSLANDILRLFFLHFGVFHLEGMEWM
ncbi:hypothetical protein POM88_047283 [Heracleum sosnowskyi]|uniref:Reverse transcriptase zinc-binding domain-containing protein n=1 Tax=Heracleum sosnowskyi TaxID=360622 RepID=A0AAD8GTF3_9APIA|nr:hypothetical protein POM88_047283 [Heracleum sosnowskyi]